MDLALRGTKGRLKIFTIHFFTNCSLIPIQGNYQKKIPFFNLPLFNLPHTHTHTTHTTHTTHAHKTSFHKQICDPLQFLFFQNLQVSWNTSTPDVTECMKDSILRNFPGIILLLFLFIGYFFVHSSIDLGNRRVSFSVAQFIKILLAISFAILSLLRVIYLVGFYNQIKNASIMMVIGPIFEILTLVFTFIKLILNSALAQIKESLCKIA